ncbi:MAG TPA: hypothetical protein VF335_03055 [Chitinivibrionales bacterium]
MKKAVLSVLLGLSIMMFIGACSVSQKTLDDGQKRIDALKAKGVPDSSLSTALVYLFQAKDANQRGNKGLAHMSADSMQILVAQAEAAYNENLTKKKPDIDALVLSLTQAKSKLSGLQVKKLDSALKVIDGFNQKNWIYQVEANANAAVKSLLPQLQFNENRAAELRTRLPGSWTCINKSKSDEDKAVNAVEKKIFSYSKDGKCKLVETKKGQSSPVLKEDWEFASYGTYDLLGDTVFMFINRFQCVKQNFENMTMKDGKKKWELKKEPTYDSAITDGSQDRWIPFSDLQRDFVQSK